MKVESGQVTDLTRLPFLSMSVVMVYEEEEEKMLLVVTPAVIFDGVVTDVVTIG